MDSVKAAYDKECGIQADEAVELPEEVVLATALADMESMNLSTAETFWLLTRTTRKQLRSAAVSRQRGGGSMDK